MIALCKTIVPMMAGLANHLLGGGRVKKRGTISAGMLAVARSVSGRAVLDPRGEKAWAWCRQRRRDARPVGSIQGGGRGDTELVAGNSITAIGSHPTSRGFSRSMGGYRSAAAGPTTECRPGSVPSPWELAGNGS